MDFSDLVALKIKELMKEKNINSNQLSKLTGGLGGGFGF